MSVTSAAFEELFTRARGSTTALHLYNLAESVSEFISSLSDPSEPPRKRVAIVGDLTMDFLASAIVAAVLRHRELPEIYIAPFGSFVAELLDPTSGLYQFKPQIVVLVPDFRNLVAPDDVSLDFAGIRNSLDAQVEQMTAHWRRLKTLLSCQIIQHTLYAAPERLSGVAERRWIGSRYNQLRYLNDELINAGADLVSFVEIDHLAAHVGSLAWAADRSYHKGRLPFDPRHLIAYLPYFEAAWRAANAKAKKALILDLDNTLWGGVIGDDGQEGVQLGVGAPQGEAFEEWQRHLKKLADRGVILAICSKNDPDIALTGLRHPAAVLGPDDFAAIECSWDDKVQGLRKIATNLNLGIDSFVFVDDNPAECDFIRRELPEVGVVHIGDDPTQFIAKFEAGCWFTATRYTQDDLERGERYSARRQAMAQKQDQVDLPSFLRGLQMKAEIAPFRESDVERLAQMETKTNQFNLTIRRYSAEQLRQFMERDDAIGRSFRLTDKFGNHGLVSSLIAIVEGDALRIDSWLMSCRVFSRGAEQAMFNHLVDVALERGLRALVGQYIPTAKNGVVAPLYKSLGFDQVDREGYWVRSLHGDVKLETFIEVDATSDAAPRILSDL